MMQSKVSIKTTFLFLSFLTVKTLVLAQTPPKSYVIKQKADIPTNVDATAIPLSMQTEMAKFNFSGDEVWIYKSKNFSGEKKVLKVGRFNLANLGNDWDNATMSCLIPLKMVVNFYSEDNFKGNFLRLIGQARPSDLKKIGTQNFEKVTVGDIFSSTGQQGKYKDFINFETTSSIVVSKL